MQKFRQSYIVSEKPVILLEKLKTLTCSNYRRVEYFLLQSLHTLPTYQCLQKGVRGFFLFCLDLELFAKIKNDLKLRFFTFLLITQVLNKTKKIPEHYSKKY